MFYVIQKNVFKDPRYDEIFKAMHELNLDYEVVQFKPNSIDFDLQTHRNDIFVYGSVKLAKVTSTFPWHPGSFYGNNHESEKYIKGFGTNSVNHDSQIVNFSTSLDWSNNSELFIKPSKDAKVFTGKVFNKNEWEDFVHNILNNPSNSRVTKETKIQISAPYQLIKEARVWIIDGKVVTSSYYRFHGNIEFEEYVSIEGILFAEEMAKLFNVADAYVMDIALTFDGWKVMEVNCINSAGFYKGDVKAIILALEEFYK